MITTPKYPNIIVSEMYYKMRDSELSNEDCGVQIFDKMEYM
jgi:hypothetical protein